MIVVFLVVFILAFALDGNALLDLLVEADMLLLGMVRCEQDRVSSHPRKRVTGLLIHGDAAFAGLGIVAECLQMANVAGELIKCLNMKHESSSLMHCLSC